MPQSPKKGAHARDARRWSRKGGPLTPQEQAEVKEEFLLVLDRCGGLVKAAAMKVGVDRATLYRWRREDKEFAAAWEEALRMSVDALESEAYRRAVTGTLKPVYQGGEQVGQVREYSDRLLERLLEARSPERYSKRMNIDGPGLQGVFQITVNRVVVTDRTMAIAVQKQIAAGILPSLPTPEQSPAGEEGNDAG